MSSPLLSAALSKDKTQAGRPSPTPADPSAALGSDEEEDGEKVDGEETLGEIFDQELKRVREAFKLVLRGWLKVPSAM